MPHTVKQFVGEGQVAAAASRQEYQRNKNTQFHSKAKSLLYQEENERAATPVHSGKKILPHAGDHNAAPFATFDGLPEGAIHATEGGQMIRSYQSPGKKKEGAGKICGMEYGSEVYRAAIVANANNLSMQKTRNWGQQGLLGQHPVTPQQRTSGTPLQDSDVHLGGPGLEPYKL